MSMKLLSRGETNENNSFNNPKIEGEEQPVNENAFETEYLIEYNIDVSTPKNSLAKTYEDKNEMIAILEVPKADYKNENIQKLLKWARTKVRENDYYRDIAVYVQMSETFERSIVFTHAEISINEESYTKSDFVTMTVTINQKRDKFAGVMFGDDIDSTYKKAWQKVLNPPRLNIYVPVKSDSNKEFAPPTGVYNIPAKFITEKTTKEQEITFEALTDSNKEIFKKKTNGAIVKIEDLLEEGYRSNGTQGGILTYSKKLITINKEVGLTPTYISSGYIAKDLYGEDRSYGIEKEKILISLIGITSNIKDTITHGSAIQFNNDVQVKENGKSYILKNSISLKAANEKVNEKINVDLTYSEVNRIATFTINPYGNLIGKIEKKDKKGRKKEVIFSPKERYFFCSDGPESIPDSKNKFVMLEFDDTLSGVVDFLFYHKCTAEVDKRDLYLCIIVKNTSSSETKIETYDDYYFSMLVGYEPEDEESKEKNCSEVEMNFLKAQSNGTITLKANEELILYKYQIGTNDIKYKRDTINASKDSFRRIYGRAKMKCLDSNKVQARVILIPKEDLNKNNIWEYSDTFEQESSENKVDRKDHSGQFSGVVKYAELDVRVKNMEKGDFIMLNDYSQGGEPLNCKGRKSGEGEPDNKEYPTPLYADEGEKYKYLFGNFGVLYNITFENPESKTLKVYPFGHSVATYASILLKDDSNAWRVENISIAEGIANDVAALGDSYINKSESRDELIQEPDGGYGKIKDILRNDMKTKIFPKASREIKINNNKLNYLLPGGNCGCIKFKME